MDGQTGRMGASSLDFSMLFVPAEVEPETLGPQPPYLKVRHFGDSFGDPIAWMRTPRTGTLLDLRVRRGHLSKRRTPTGVLDLTDDEQRADLLTILRRAIDLTPNRWAIYGYWSGLDEEIRDARECGPPDEPTLLTAETDVLYKFSDPQPWPR